MGPDGAEEAGIINLKRATEEVFKGRRTSFMLFLLLFFLCRLLYDILFFVIIYPFKHAIEITTLRRVDLTDLDRL